MRRTVVAIALLGLSLTGGCTRTPAPVEESPVNTGAPPKIANPASKHCADVGGKLRIERGPAGGEYGVCFFEDNRQCEEWSLLRGECPVGGVRVTGYATAAARFCAITGGRHAVVARSGAADEQGTCTLPGGKTCDADAYYGRTCHR